ncbi:hypothetical protein HNQ96_000150 [Aminobacter lissarensis]|uniref:Uncharacterized protein n=1 Tax=Aminobacter carboxidus TaxID=376165 RepID=A0A8E2BA35_9HYPH|nr:hypothetical protein [Aminobacter lissarensis]MBB6464303.1 hypothetical protein [Aminobacter lissarensis]
MPMIWGGLTGPAVHWTVGPSRIEIVQKRPFQRDKHHVFQPGQIERFETLECPAMESDSTWRVTIVGRDSRRFDTRHFGPRKTADAFRERIESLFNS